MRKKQIAAAISSLLLITALPSHAGDLKINGFATMAMSQLDSDDDYQWAPYNEDIDFKNGSRFAVQLKQDVNSMVSVTGQLISRGNNNFETEAAWAYVSVTPVDDSTLRIGRLRTPLYYYSDFLEVGYAYNWVRPPIDLYDSPFSAYEGVDFTQSFSIGELDSRVQIYTGSVDQDIVTDGETSRLVLDTLSGVVLNSSWHEFTFRVSYHKADMPVATGGVAATTAIFTEQFAAAAVARSGGMLDMETARIIVAGQAAAMGEKFGAETNTSAFGEAAVVYDNGTHFAIVEFTQVDHDHAAIVDDESWMASYGYRIDKFIPHITLSEKSLSFESGTVGDIQRGIPRSSIEKTSSVTVGIRYDVAANTAFKFELQQSEAERATDDSSQKGTLATAAIDVVF